MRKMVRGNLEAGAADAVAAFVEEFRAVWAAPTIEGLDLLTNPDVCYSQPLLPNAIGRERANAYWRRMFTLIPDLHLDVVNWGVSADHIVYIELWIRGTFGRKPFSWPAIDRYELDVPGRVRNRILWCDPLTAANAMLRPRALAALARASARIGTAAARTAARSAHRRPTTGPLNAVGCIPLPHHGVRNTTNTTESNMEGYQ
jgi:hypothetical protein